VIRPITDRRVFTRLQTEGRRVRHDDLWVRWLPDDDCAHPHVAFAVGRAAGPAVTRNRIRRRLRVVLREHAARGLAPGWYLLGAGGERAAQPAGALRADVDRLLAVVRTTT
jgi:RNase P protein component